MTRFSIRALGAFLAPLALAAALPVCAAAQTIAVTNGRVITNGDAGVIESGTVLIRDGVIAEVGAQVRIPSGARVIDAEGGWITPGLFHPQTELGLVEVSAESGARDNAASGSSFTASMDVADAFNPAGNHIASARVKGVTRFAVHPAVGSAIIAGRGALADASGDPDSLFADRQFMLVDLSVSGARTAGGARSAAWAFLRAAIEDARFYPGRFMAHHEGDAINRFDAAAMVDVARGAMPLIMPMDRASDIRRAIQFADRYPNIRLIIVGGAEAISWPMRSRMRASPSSSIPCAICPKASTRWPQATARRPRCMQRGCSSLTPRWARICTGTRACYVSMPASPWLMGPAGTMPSAPSR